MRDELIGRVNHGRLTPEEAEVEAKRLGLGSFARDPNPDDFDPLAEVNWTLPMAVAWISFRTVDAVREAWAAYRENCWHWLWRRWQNGPDGEVHEGWFLEQHRFPSLRMIELAELVDKIEDDTSPPPMMSVGEAREALWIALGEGILSATAIPRRGGARVTIEPLEWPGLSPNDSDYRDELSGNGFSLAYVDMLVPSSAMLRLWGPRREARASLPTLIRPDGFGYMPLSCAAQWIAAEGGTRDFDPLDEASWRGAFNGLLAAISSEKVRVVGTRNGSREPVPGYSFASIVVDFPSAEAPLELIMSEAVYLQCYPYVDEEQWQSRFHDSLMSWHKVHWTHLLVEKGDIRKLWPFGSNAAGTGAPGRPSKSMDLILDEFERRIAQSSLAPSLREEATALVDWLKTEYSTAERPTIKTVENRIRDAFRTTTKAPK